MVFVWIKIAGDNCSVAESANKLFNELKGIVFALKYYLLPERACCAF